MWIPRNWVLVKTFFNPYVQCGQRVYYNVETKEYITVYTDSKDVQPDRM